MTFTRITVDPDLMAGVPTIRGLRIPVATVVSMVADGMTAEEICRDLPDLALEDVAEACAMRLSPSESGSFRFVPLNEAVARQQPVTSAGGVADRGGLGCRACRSAACPLADHVGSNP